MSSNVLVEIWWSPFFSLIFIIYWIPWCVIACKIPRVRMYTHHDMKYIIEYDEYDSVFIVVGFITRGMGDLFGWCMECSEPMEGAVMLKNQIFYWRLVQMTRSSILKLSYLWRLLWRQGFYVNQLPHSSISSLMLTIFIRFLFLGDCIYGGRMVLWFQAYTLWSIFTSRLLHKSKLRWYALKAWDSCHSNSFFNS